MKREVFAAIAVAVFLGCGGGGGHESASDCPSFDSSSSGGQNYFEGMSVTDNIPREVGREIGDNCSGWHAGIQNGLFQLTATNDDGRPVATLIWDDVLDSIRFYESWSGEFDGGIRMGMTFDEVQRLRPQIPATDPAVGRLEEDFPDGREVFYYFNGTGNTLYLIFARGRLKYLMF